MRTGLFLLVALLSAALAWAAVTPEEFRSSHGHKKHQKESEREEAVAEELGPVKEPVKVQAPKHKHTTPYPLKPLIHPIPSHPPAHAEAAPNHHHRAQMTGPSPVIHAIPSHPPPVAEASDAPAEHPKKQQQKKQRKEE